MALLTFTRTRRRSRDVGEGITNPSLRLAGKTGLTVLALFGLLPVYWLVATAFTPRQDVFSVDRPYLPLDPTLANFREFFDNSTLLKDLGNSVVVSAGTALISVVVSGLMAYSLSKFRYRGRNTLMVMFLVGQLVPGALLLVTLYLMFNSAGLLYTYTAVILAFTTFTLPLSVFLLKGIIDALPDEILEAAKMDGLSNTAILFRIVFPLIVPGLITTAMFAFMRAWSDLLFALTIAGPDKQTLTVGMTTAFIHDGAADWPGLMAASVLTSLPLAVIFVLLQRYFVSGLAAGAVKG
ncbi:carbohydrate ABC transporter permease [Streptacidiphilus sp. P02-A3a]|uniref:carbohydrate ABC transporter permease n=1 Tax=Streptacidiphilus sp. P02-A3a TaxID=2704468 RepID=UPI0015FA4665|nr:carbohydrate ABC transporter permease [Streptacidiphilus sp. P02-A3a]QMU70172.1 carbohydrate ABC transporter permease [Streptacidiphilus sp. P02-A3a]QMU70378.1 carbohydrate ABC transporter permease [Streptacidiphilus sp. P02-A3a]